MRYELFFSAGLKVIIYVHATKHLIFPSSVLNSNFAIISSSIVTNIEPKLSSPVVVPFPFNLTLNSSFADNVIVDVYLPSSPATKTV